MANWYKIAERKDGKFAMIAVSDESHSVTFECCETGHDTQQEAQMCDGWKRHEVIKFPKPFDGVGHKLIEFIGVSKLVYFNERTGLLCWSAEAAEKIENWLIHG